MKKIFETAIILFATFGFWGMIYPDLCFTEEVCRVISYDNTGVTKEGYSDDEGNTDTGKRDIHTGICKAQPNEIVIKSRLLDALGIDTDKADASEKESKGKSNVNNRYGEESGAKRGSGGGI